MPTKLVKVKYTQELENFQYSNFLAINKNLISKIDL